MNLCRPSFEFGTMDALSFSIIRIRRAPEIGYSRLA